jgi:radical SAM protein with 4Fe4S-binding SPASM domain
MHGLNGWWDRLRAELRDLLPSAGSGLEAGLYTYPIDLEGGRRRIHLRLESDGAGVLFIDVNDVIHLNATAAQMAKLALEEVPIAEAERQVRRCFRGAPGPGLAEDLAEIYAMIDQLRSPETGCPTCELVDRLAFKPVFSTPVSAPFKADLALTYACNNACAHCYNEPARFEMDSLRLAGWTQVLDTLAEVGVPHVILTGGEPTLHPDLPAIVRHADELGLIVGMNSNGRRLADPRLVETLTDAGLNHVQITLESCRADVHDGMVGREGAFDQTVAGIRQSLAGGIHTITNTTLTTQNADHALEIIAFLDDLGLRTFAMNGIIHAGGGYNTPEAIPAPEMMSVLAAVRDEAAARDLRFLWYTVTEYCQLSPLALDLQPKRCNAAEYSICIEPNGDVLPCQSYYVSAGNLLTDSWSDIWNSDLFLSFRDREENPEAAGLPRACWDCPDLEVCGGGCRLEREARAGIRAAERGCARARVQPAGAESPDAASDPTPARSGRSLAS